MLSPGEHAGDRAQVRSPEGASLEATDAQTEGELGPVRADPGPGLGCGPSEERAHRQGHHHGSSRRDGPGGVLEAG